MDAYEILNRNPKPFIEDYRLWLEATNKAEKGQSLAHLTREEKMRVLAVRRNLMTVYFVAAPDAGVIKVGQTTDIEKRFATLRTGSPCPLELITAVKYHAGLERRIHDHLQEWRSHGEWFFADKPVIEFVRGVRDGGIEWVIDTLELERPENDYPRWMNNANKSVDEDLRHELEHEHAPWEVIGPLDSIRAKPIDIEEYNREN